MKNTFAAILTIVMLAALQYPTAAAPKKAELPALDKAQLKYVEKTAPTVRRKFAKAAAGARGADKELLARWFPELRPTLGEPGQCDPPPLDQPSKLRIKLAKMQADLAGDAQKAGMPATASWEAFRAHKLDPANPEAAKILGYVERPGDKICVHPRVAKLMKDGKHAWPWGWTKQPAALPPPTGPAKDGGDKAHAKWEQARELEYTFVSLRSDLPLEKASMIGRRVNALLETMRARYCLVEGYTEPAWPLKVWVIATDAEYNKVWSDRGEQPGSPFGEYSYRHRIAHVNAENCEQGFEKTVGIAQHESCHAFFNACFKGSFERGNATPYGWMLEAVPAAVYYVDPQHPVDGQLGARLKRKFQLRTGGVAPAMQTVLDGENCLGKLNAHGTYNESIGDLQAYITGALFSAMCWQDDRMRDAFAKFTAHCMAWKAEKDEFEKTFGDTKEVTAKLKEWLS